MDIVCYLLFACPPFFWRGAWNLFNYKDSTILSYPVQLFKAFLRHENKKMTVRVTRKPNSVSDTQTFVWAPGNDHSSGLPIARQLVRPTRELERAALKRSSIWSCTGWGLPSFPGRPGNWCALTAPFHPYPALKPRF